MAATEMGPEVEAMLIEASSLHQRGDASASERLCRQSLKLETTAVGYALLGSALYGQNKTEEAASAFDQALTLDRNNAIALNNYARLLHHSGNLSSAIELYRRAAKQSPDNKAVRLNLVRALGQSGRTKETLREAQSVARGFKDDAECLQLLSAALIDAGKLTDAKRVAEETLRLRPDMVEAHTSIANIERNLGDSDASLAAYAKAMDIAPSPVLHSAYLATMNYVDTNSEFEVLAEAKRWAELHTADTVAKTEWPAIEFQQDKKLRVGFMSGDFRRCSTPLLCLSMLRNRPRDDWDMICYATRIGNDDMTDEFKDLSNGWRDIASMSDADAVALIMDDKIDILIDMNGHTFGNRMQLLAHKPAPVQVRWINNVMTSGLKSIDYLFGDDIHTPAEDQPFYTETLRRLPTAYIRLWMPDDLPEVGVLPALKNGYVTFGCFNSAFKVSQANFDAWANILRKTPTSRLILNSPEYAAKETRRRFQGLLEDRGIVRKRIEFIPGAEGHKVFLASYSRIDIALDTFPFSGGLTTSEALYMGVPTVTFPGARFSARHAKVHLSAVGLTDWIGTDAKQYVEIAAAKADNVEDLASLRIGLRRRLQKSSLMNGKELADAFTELLREVWRENC